MKTAPDVFHTRSMFRAMDKAEVYALLQGGALVSESKAGYIVQSVPADAAKAIAGMMGEAVTGFGKVISVALANRA